MSTNFSSPSNESDDLSSTNSTVIYCYHSTTTINMVISFTITKILLLLPLCILVLHHGLHQWRQKRSTSSAVTVSHSDMFTFHMVFMELLRMVGGSLICVGIHMVNLYVHIAGNFLFTFTWFGQMFFHLLTCVERYLAVVHPITYINMKTERGIRIRNISIGSVWLLCFVGTSFYIHDPDNQLPQVFPLILSIIVVSFCSLSVLCVLIRPGPGERGGVRVKLDQSKLKAFYTIMVILGVLVLRFSWTMSWIVNLLYGSEVNCVIMLCEIWVDLPSSLVLPLLYLNRAGKLECCKKKNQQG